MTTDKTPTDAEIAALYADETGFALAASHGQAPAGASRFGSPELQARIIARLAEKDQAERVYAFRRKGLADFCTCDEARYEELSNKPHLFETRIFYTAPQPSPTAQAAESVPAPVPPPECETEAEKRAFAFGWFKALESERMKADSVQEDAARYRLLRRGQHWSVIDGIGNNLRAEVLDAAVDAARKQGGV